jgi:tight adherence protein C
MNPGNPGMSPDTLVFGLAAVDLAAWLSGAAAFAVVLLVWTAFMERDPLESRLKALRHRRDALKGEMLRPGRRAGQVASSIGQMRHVVEYFKLARGKTAAKVARQLAQAGWRSRDALVIYLFAKAGLTIMLGLGAVVALYVLKLVEVPEMQRLAVCAGAALVGSMAPEWVVGRRTRSRQAAIRRALPDALDLLVICAEAGLSLDAAFERVSREMGESCPELAAEVGLTAVELGFLPDRAKALHGLVDRVPLPGVRALMTTLAQTERYGTPLAQSMRVLAAEMRNERMMRAEEKAARLPAVLTLPLMLFIMPPLFIVLVGPAVLSVVDTLLGLK